MAKAPEAPHPWGQEYLSTSTQSFSLYASNITDERTPVQFLFFPFLFLFPLLQPFDLGRGAVGVKAAVGVQTKSNGRLS